MAADPFYGSKVGAERNDDFVSNMPDEVFEKSLGAPYVFSSYLVESYLKDERRLNSLRIIQAKTRNLPAILQNPGHPTRDVLGVFGPECDSTKLIEPKTQRPVLIMIRESLKDGQTMTIRTIHPVIRLHLLDNCRYFRCYGSDPTGIKLFNPGSDRERTVRSLLFGQTPTFMFLTQSENEGVEGSSQIVEYVTHNDAQEQGWFFDYMKPEDIDDLVALALPITDDFVWEWRANEVIALGFETNEMFVGSPEPFFNLSQPSTIADSHV